MTFIKCLAICPRCNKEFMKTRERQKFCSSKCKCRFNSDVRHNKLKDNPEYKLKTKNQFLRWVSKNREKHLLYMRNYMKIKFNEPNYREKQNEYKRNHRKQINAGQLRRYYERKDNLK